MNELKERLNYLNIKIQRLDLASRVMHGFGHKTLKNNAVSISCKWGAGDLPEGRKTDRALVKTIVVLIRNTTWRCGKLEKSIVRHLHKKQENLGKKDVYVNDVMHNLNFAGEKKNEFLDALRRLEKRNIVRLLP